MLYINERSYYLRSINAVVVELVDTGDLKSPGCLGCTGSSPVGGI